MALPTPKLTEKLSCGDGHIQASRKPSGTELDAQDGRCGGQKRNARAHRPERAVQQQVERHAHRVRRDARHCHLPLAAQRGQDAHRHEVADARHEAHRADDPHRSTQSPQRELWPQ